MRIQCKTQNSAEWFAARLGKVTASRMGDAMARLSRASKSGAKGDWSAAHLNYAADIAWEIIIGTAAWHHVSKEMDIGREFEGEAREQYWQRFMRVGGNSFERTPKVQQTGFVLHPTIDWIGASPDGLVGDDGCVELKVPTFNVHRGYLEDDEIPSDYQLQLQCVMLCCGRKWGDFVSYCPTFVHETLPDEFRMYRKRLLADPAVFAEMESAALAVMERATSLVLLLRERYPAPERAAEQVGYEDADYDPSKAFADQDFSFLDNNLMDVP